MWVLKLYQKSVYWLSLGILQLLHKETRESLSIGEPCPLPITNMKERKSASGYTFKPRKDGYSIHSVRKYETWHQKPHSCNQMEQWQSTKTKTKHVFLPKKNIHTLTIINFGNK